MSTQPFQQYGDYELLRPLASGGMADLYLARKLGVHGFQKLVVVKCIRRELLHDEAVRKMFLNEAHIAARIDHPHVVQITDLGQAGDSYFIAMEYIRGQTLHSMLNRVLQSGTKVDLNVWIRVMDMALDGLHATHEVRDENGKPMGLVHRDFTPSNIMITYAGTVKVIDFGVARIQQPDNLTQAGTIKGKVGYLSPEQCEGRELDRRSDLFAAGIVLWEMIANQRLFANRPQLQIMKAITSGDIAMPQPTDGHPLDPRLETALKKALTVDVRQRYQTAAEMRDDLREYLHDMSNVGTYEIAELIQRLFTLEKEADSRLTATADPQSDAGRTMVGKGTGATPRSFRQLPTQSAEMSGPVSGTHSESGPSRGLLIAAGLGALAIAGAIGAWIAWPREVSVDKLVVEAAQAPTAPATTTPAATVATTPSPTVPSPTLTPSPPPSAAPPVAASAPPEPSPRPILSAQARALAAQRAEEARGWGTLDFDTDPYTTVFLGKKNLGETPLVGVRVPAGELTLTLQNEEQKIKEVFKVLVPKNGRVAKKLKL